MNSYVHSPLFDVNQLDKMSQAAAFIYKDPASSA